MNDASVPVELTISGGTNLVAVILAPLPPGDETTSGLKDDSSFITAASLPYTVGGTLTYVPPTGFTGAPPVHFRATDDGGNSDPANHYLCIQDTTDQVVISEIMTTPSLDGTIYEYVEVYNTTGGDITLWALAGDLVNDAATPEVSGNLNGVILPAGMSIIAPSTTPDQDEAFRCEWSLRSTEVIRVATDTWEALHSEESLVALYGSGATLLDTVWIRGSALGWPDFVVPGDVGNSYAYDSSSTLTTARNDAGFRWKLSGEFVDSSHTTAGVRESETAGDLGSPGFVKTLDETYLPGPKCLCCLPDGSCTSADQGTCENLLCGQYFESDGLDCDSNPPSCVSTHGACCTAFGDCIDDLTPCECGLLGGTFQGPASTCGVVVCNPPTDVIINELDYDNPSTDTEEFIELLGPPGMSLSGWKIQLFNGLDGIMYDEIDLSAETIPADRFLVIGSATVANVDLVAFTQDGIQNGSPDGVVLCNGSTIVEAVSYEGSVAALDVCTTGVNLNLPDIGASEAGANGSLQKLPNGGAWEATFNKTPGETNFVPDCVTIAVARSAGVGAGVSLCDVVVSSTTDLINSTGFKNFQLQDSTGGITVFGFNSVIDDLLNAIDPTNAEGFQIDISGTTDEFVSLFELSDGATALTLDNVDGFVGIPTPVAVTLTDLQDFSPTAEGLESVLVVLECVAFVDIGGTFIYGNHDVSDGDLTAVMRVSRADMPMVGQPIPVGFVDIVGLFGQFGGVNDGYQLLPRSMSDITTAACTPPEGGCCVGLSCSVGTFVDCAGLGGTYLGGGTGCSPNPCLPQGTCCLPTGACVITDEIACLADSGLWNGDPPIDCGQITCNVTASLAINE
ncbi:MAG: hypothetical protein IID40_10125, partial [Planctomycetes bacterium]|nr:hypothetical protein [Planctomycetota bacterium]